ncbi:Oligoxyloglucan reducing end-specific cellobiohydrolase [Gloeophyllum trabeum ATCC 11539]|uniref:Vacuolar protein sorting/targeting protein 10 n=1 Tax=Gloeophyllum trabeum (strain ATCC 11539 / FP-39264 / Madison 617) TaxID=670483 RepID=S7RSZ5_GLOTA|nr:Oligoxyloglucan reducing end-specific cellobiohydrolase [Gloeophyllum trabeum ATCC 11539]EPQ56214.1 Oligoxyloglucan reducing end-specific cellobiohydrolase [Gloeophyllum trabeum ATCC 11539]
MAPLHRTAAFLAWSITILLCVLLSGAQDIEKSITYFNNLPARLFFFDDTTTVIYHDVVEGNVYVSQDEGKTWNRAADIPAGDASMVIEHPFDNRYAFVLTRHKTHWRTEDRGRTWRSFTMPIVPAYTSRPLSFHSDPAKYGYILYQGTVCDRLGWGSVCHDETYYTKEAFSDEPKLLLTETSRCQFAHSSKDFKHDAHPDLIYCVGFDTTTLTGTHSLSSSRVFSSTDFFQQENKVEDLGIGKNARGVVAFAIVSKFAVVALKDLSPGSEGDMLLYVSVDTKTWAKAQFPHATSARLRENAYTIVESTIHSLAVDVVLQTEASIGTLFVSNSNGTYFVESLRDTNRNEMGYVDYETIYGVEGVGLANVVVNAQEVERGVATKQLKTMITFDDGSSWSTLQPPSTDSEGRRIPCDPADKNECSLHLHSVTTPHNFGRIFSSPAPGFIMGVGSIGAYLQPYEECDTFLSTDAGLTWRMIRRDAHKYEFGDQGTILVAVNDEEGVDTIRYSTDEGRTWNSYNYGVKMRARALTSVPDATSQKFILLGQIARRDQTAGQGRYAIVYLDFAGLGRRQCTDNDFENWYARSAAKECLMGHKLWYKRRKADADCYVGNKFTDPVGHEEDCPCTDEDFECDYNFVRNGKECVPVGPEPIPAGVCSAGDPNQTYMGSSGYRLIPGDTCSRERGISKDDKVEKKCSEAQPQEGDIIHQTFEFSAPVVQQAYFADSQTILVRLADGSIWQSSNEGYTWTQPVPDQRFVVFYLHPYTNDRGYLVTPDNRFYYTTDVGRTWNPMNTPTVPNTFGAQVLHFQPQNSDYIIWTGNEDCEGFGANCHAVAHYSRDNGRHWNIVETYVRNCQWARDAELKVDKTHILCESWRDKKGNQRFFMQSGTNALELVSGTDYFATKTKLFNHVVGFTKFSEYLIVAEYVQDRQSLELQVSLDGRKFATGMFPPSMRPTQHAYTMLESSTMSVFLHVTTSEPPNPYWGSILKSNSNGTYFGVALDNVNRDERGYVDFEKMIGLDGIALVNVVSNPSEAPLTGTKKLQSRITHNDGGSWKSLTPPTTDSQGLRYDCTSVSCALHVHGYTERRDPRATYSTPSVPGLLMAVGNVGESLAPYTESDTFLSRDGGFTWEEVHKDAHLWEFGDSGSILVMANDEEPTDHVLFSTDEGKTWREYKFTDDKLRVYAIVTVPSDTSRRFILFGSYPRSPSAAVAVHIDFSALTTRQCVLDVQDPAHDDFELWSPSHERAELCLFGRQTMFHRRRREANCVVGNQAKAEERIVRNCACDEHDFECEFNHVRDSSGSCVLVEGTQPLPSDPETSCRNGEDYWYERTPYRKIPYSSCEDGLRLDRGERHVCPGFKAHGAFFWWTVIVIPFMFTALVAYWYYRRSGMARGTIRLPGGEPGMSYRRSESGIVSTLASVPWFLVGIAGIAYEYVAEAVDSLTTRFRSRSGYRNVPVDEDAQILRFEDEE